MQGKKTKQFKFKLYFFVEKLSFRKKHPFADRCLGVSVTNEMCHGNSWGGNDRDRNQAVSCV